MRCVPFAASAADDPSGSVDCRMAQGRHHLLLGEGANRLADGIFASSSTMGTPRLIDAGTSRALGICPAIGMRSDFSTSLSSKPTFESDRLTTTRQLAWVVQGCSVSSVSLRFLSAGMSSVAMRARTSVWSKIAST